MLELVVLSSSRRDRKSHLVNILVGDDCERGRVEEDVVVLVEVPEARVDVAETVVSPFPEVGNDDDQEELDEDAHGASVIGVG